jgi:seryl-tRNA synthetase
LAAGEIFRFGSGRYGFGPRTTRLMQAFQRLVDDRARGIRATPYVFPTVIGGDLLERCSYIKSFAQSVSLVSHLREDLHGIQDFAATTRWEGEHLHYDASRLAPASCLLSPSVCFHWYAVNAGMRHAQLQTSTATGKCFRWESGNLSGLERLYDFTMQEIIFLGRAQEVLAKRQEAIVAATAFFDALGVAYEIRSATDPFFIDTYATQTTFQKAFDLKFEVRALLPYKNATFAVGSFNYHQDVFGRAFDIRDTEDQFLHSGCEAYGLERIALMVFAQFGLDPAGWPKSLAEQLRL